MRFRIALCLGSCLIFLSCSEKRQAEAESTAVSVKVVPVQRVRQPATIAVSGSVESPDAPSNAAFLVSGKVVRVGPREGEFVGKGQVLAAIDPTDYRIAVAAAAAQAGVARATFEKAEAPARPEQLEQAKVAFERAQDEYRRMKMLYDSKSLAPNDFQKFETAYISAKEQYAQAQAGAQKEDKAQAKAALDQALASEELARKRLSDATLYAPFDGYVAKRSIELGDMASAGRPVFTIVRLNPVEVNVGIPESDVRLVKIGQRAMIRMPALPDLSFEGRVRVVNVSADPSTRTYMTRIAVPNPKHILRLGMIAEVQIRGDRMLDLMTVPGEAVVRDAQGATMVFVYFPEQQRVYTKRVDVGSVYGKDVEIKQGLTGNESIVAAGQQMLQNGTRVRVNGSTASQSNHKANANGQEERP